MKKSLSLLTLLFISSVVFAQNNVGIGTNNPRNSAILDLYSQDKGLLLPRVDTINMTGLVAADHGLMVYDTTMNKILIYNGASWESAAGSSDLNGLSDVNITSPAPNNFLRYIGGQWINTSSIFPINETVATAGTQFQLNHIGLGNSFRVTNTSPFASDYVISGEALGDAIAGYFVNNQATATNQALYTHTLGSGPAMVGLGLSNTATAARFANTTPGNTQPTLILENAGTGLGLNVVSGGVQVNRFGGGGQKMIVTDNNGLLDTLAIGSATSLQAAYDGGQTIVTNAGNINITSSGTNPVLTIDDTNENVGIGTPSPNANFQLDVVGGDISVSGVRFGAGLSGVSSNVAAGAGALNSNSTGSFNVAVGQNALSANLDGFRNVALGEFALSANTSGIQNVGVGSEALGVNQLGIWNTAIGTAALKQNEQSFNTAIGKSALEFNVNGGENTGIGISSLQNSADGRNTGLGSNSGSTLNLGSDNTFLGYNANAGVANLNNATAIGANTIVGSSNSLVLGNNANVGIGTSTPANKLEVIGDAAKFDSVIIANNAQAGYVLTAADATGAASWQPAGAGSSWNLTGNNSIIDGTNFIGTTTNVPLNFRTNNIRSGRIEPDSPWGTFFGFEAGLNNGAAQANAAFGYQALRGPASAGNTAFGYSAMRVTNGGQNVAIGDNAMLVNTNGGQNTAVGSGAMAGMNASYNTGIGLFALNQSTGDNNTAIGGSAGSWNSSGVNNTYLGYQAGYPQASVANAIETGSNNVMLGANTGLSQGSQVSNSVAIGSNARIDASNAMALGAKGASRLNVGINTNTPNPNADLTLNSNDRGLQLNRVDASQISGLASIDKGLIYYDSISQEIVYWNGADFDTVSNSGAASSSSPWNTVGNDINYTAGNVGIGNSAPTAQLDINIVSPAQIALRVTNGNITSNNAAVVQFDANATLTNAFRLQRNGNVGIGTASPTAKLDVAGDINLTGEVNRPSTGDANLVPIAMGSILLDGSISAASPNVTASQLNQGEYQIIIAGVSLTSEVIVSLSPRFSGGQNVTVEYEIIGGNLIVRTFRASGGNPPEDSAFSFLIFRI